MSILTWFLDTPFMDDDEAVRNFTSKYIGPILLSDKEKDMNPWLKDKLEKASIYGN